MLRVAKILHRWLAIVIGIQILAWVIGGIYFSWTDLDWIHGDHLLRRPQPVAAGEINPRVLATVLAHLQARENIRAWKRIDFIEPLDKAVIRIRYRNDAGERTALFTAADGRRLPPLNRDQARKLAERVFVPDAPVSRIDYLTELPPGHEYRGHPLPAWAVHFDHPGHPTVYVAAELAAVTAIRHDGWRVFDFLWMLHTLDLHSRDDINNPLLRTLALAGLAVVLSGYGLYLALRRFQGQRRSRRAQRSQ
ncbi:Na+-transporting NADH:ubiquinone oxidoreductase subunit F [Methylomarinovum caldicuralii]|uniref:Na+-transporting NADH:ubiquinone oxidoreductase subunit F n=1 Tax=Methylomarinovum caldicuralii TaxID=438856 RepID=A0AAU9BY76_9GAMM|nr:PepSY domain-containing protein [Methylomarinovum caldicuralii]BCX81235.1 Na+-transporting NADH:ubiquinone oxidoreductase subunit F [Methylomarinovum caldicuralii]